MDISDRLDQAMQKAGFQSQSALSRACGVPQPTINRILKRAGSSGPESETIKKIAAACNVSFSWLMEGHDDLTTRRENTWPFKTPLSEVIAAGLISELDAYIEFRVARSKPDVEETSAKSA